MIAKMIELEETIGRLYEIYHDLFPSQKGFWATLAAEEKEHAEWISKFAILAKYETLVIHPERFKPKAMQMTVDSLDKQIEQSRTGKVSLLDALSVAFNFEDFLTV